MNIIQIGLYTCITLLITIVIIFIMNFSMVQFTPTAVFDRHFIDDVLFHYFVFQELGPEVS